MPRKAKKTITKKVYKSNLDDQKVVQIVKENKMGDERRMPRLNYNVVLAVLLVVASFLIGRLSSQVEYLKGNGGAAAPSQAGQQGTVAQQPAGTAAPSLIDVPGLKNMASSLKLDVNKFNSCLDSGKYAKKVSDDLAYGGQVGVNGTPTFFINGVMLVGAQPQAEFEKVIDAELKDKSGDKVIAGGKRITLKSGGYVKGSKNAPIKIVEFTDYQCPFCISAFPTIEALLGKYGDKISLESRHNPLSFHPYAQKAAEASECAGEQGKFWEMHDKMFGSQSANQG